MGGDDGGKMEGVMRWWLEAHWMGGAPVVFLVEDDDVWCQRWDLRRWKSLAADNWEEATVKLCLSAVQLYLSCVSSLTCYDGRQRLRGGGERFPKLRGTGRGNKKEKEKKTGYFLFLKGGGIERELCSFLFIALQTYGLSLGLHRGLIQSISFLCP